MLQVNQGYKFSFWDANGVEDVNSSKSRIFLTATSTITAVFTPIVDSDLVNGADALATHGGIVTGLVHFGITGRPMDFPLTIGLDVCNTRCYIWNMVLLRIFKWMAMD